MKNIVLTGFMGAGKTSVACELSRMLSMKIVDMDAEIEKEQGITITEIFARFGEQRFREIETDMARRVGSGSGAIISTGGGVVLKDENMAYLRNNGVIVCLTASPETVLERTVRSNDRPLLNVDDPLRKIKELIEARLPFYKKADLVVKTDDKTPLQVAEEIVEGLQWKR